MKLRLLIENARRIVVVAIVLGVLATAGTGASAPAQSGDPIVVGSTLSLTGAFAATGVIHKAAGETFVRWINANGGLLGRPVEWKLFDDASDPAKVTALYERLISQDRVDLIMGPYATPNIVAAQAIGEPASLDMTKARAMQPDWTTFNGYANQYVTHPLTADPGDTVRFYVVAAGPTLDTDFHVVGTIFDRAWVNGDMTQFQQGVQTVGVPAGGGAVFDVKIDEPGLYPFVSHAFAHVDLGQVGVLKIGNPRGGSSH